MKKIGIKEGEVYMVKISESMQKVLDVNEEKDKEIINSFKKNSKKK